MFINGKKIKARYFAYDECHKIYLLSSAKDIKEAEAFSYAIYPINLLPEAFESSCSLRFISTWGLRNVVPQFADKVLFQWIENRKPKSKIWINKGGE